MKKLFAVVCAVLLLGACVSQPGGYPEAGFYAVAQPECDAPPYDDAAEAPAALAPIVTEIEWKAVYEDWSGAAHLYLVVNGEDEHYLGYFWPGVNFRLNSGIDVRQPPGHVLSTLSTRVRFGGLSWRGEWLYVYRRSDTELAVMHRSYISPSWAEEAIEAKREELGDEEFTRRFVDYRELLTIPAGGSGPIHVSEHIAIVLPQTPPFGEDQPFAALLGAYAALALSSYTQIDEELLGDSFLAERSLAWDEPWQGFGPAIFYALHDINGDGVPELFIGTHFGNFEREILGIYTLRDGEAVSVVRPGGRASVHLLTDIDGNYIIETAWGHMDYGGEAFYTLNVYGESVRQELLLTEGLDWSDVVWGDDNEWVSGEPSHIRFRVVGGDFEGEWLRITEEEYIALLRQFGSFGYFPQEYVEARHVRLDWTPILTRGPAWEGSVFEQAGS